MQNTLSILRLLLLCGLQHADGQRRTAPRRTTVEGGTYGTETFPTEPPTTPMLTTTSAAKVAALPQPAQLPPPRPAASVGQWNAQPVAQLPVLPSQPAGLPSFPGLPDLPPQPAGFPASGLPPLPGFPAGVGAPFAPGIMAIPGAVQLPSAAFAARPAGPPVTTTTERYDDDAGMLPNLPVDKTPVVSLCEEVEEILPPGTTQEECFTADPIQLRYWQPYRALRNIKCKYGNDTAPPQNYKDRCGAAYKGATCVQKYQQFVVLAAMGPAASGWSCVRLGSGCSCSVRAVKRLRMTDFEQRTDLREFMRS
ncbi:protein diaphanous homolog 1-like [Paramacrobiotus metropolitanus]|uniref:protein diaphanous homolog 1-like n=1 Tax=Paramacrobiotus metropolitanus TaxID=2943436 RepID=UPI00244604E6|nr:protein diaphanous homolog 1-like [Paramacrobiotus metropolitanus]